MVAPRDRAAAAWRSERLAVASNFKLVALYFYQLWAAATRRHVARLRQLVVGEGADVHAGRQQAHKPRSVRAAPQPASPAPPTAGECRSPPQEEFAAERMFAGWRQAHKQPPAALKTAGFAQPPTSDCLREEFAARGMLAEWQQAHKPRSKQAVLQPASPAPPPTTSEWRSLPHDDGFAAEGMFAGWQQAHKPPPAASKTASSAPPPAGDCLRGSPREEFAAEGWQQAHKPRSAHAVLQPASLAPPTTTGEWRGAEGWARCLEQPPCALDDTMPCAEAPRTKPNSPESRRRAAALAPLGCQAKHPRGGAAAGCACLKKKSPPRPPQPPPPAVRAWAQRRGWLGRGDRELEADDQDDQATDPPSPLAQESLHPVTQGHLLGLHPVSQDRRDARSVSAPSCSEWAAEVSVIDASDTRDERFLGHAAESRGRPKAGFAYSAEHRKRLLAFFTHYNPNKLPSVIPTLREFRGREEEMMRRLVQSYGPEPSPSCMDAPLLPGWEQVESKTGDIWYVRSEDSLKTWKRPTAARS
ncbi:hypothetical protein DIPPA_26073 [Diplonema papillatum]|nr:hypothetical protein DIPPA_26073 [Diplonema papillatum]